MFAKNLVFLGLASVGAVILLAMLRPVAVTDRVSVVRAVQVDPGLEATVRDVDDAFEKMWRESGVRPVGRATDLEVARRLSLALAGTIPSLEEIRWLESLEGEDAPSAYVEKLLADRRSADYLAERVGRMLVGNEGGPFLLYRRRRFVMWLSDQLHAGQSYDAILRKVIAGTGLWTNNPETNFITVAFTEDSSTPDANKLAGRVTRAMLGLRLDCAQCHDHPFVDRWKQHDFESLAAFFGSTGFAEDLAALKGIGDELGPYQITDSETDESRSVEPAVPFLENLLPAEGSPRERLAEWITSPENEFFARATVNRIWHLLLGRPLVEPVDDIPVDTRLPAALDILARDFAAEGYDVRRLIRAITRTRVFRLASAAAAGGEENEVTGAHTLSWAAFPLTRLRGEQAAGSVLQARSLATVDHESHILVRLYRSIGETGFLERYGDAGDDELEPTSGTIPQRLLLMNGETVDEAIQPEPVTTSAGRIALLSPTPAAAVRTAYLTVLTRPPTENELEFFTEFVGDEAGETDGEKVSDLFWTLINSTEFSWNH